MPFFLALSKGMALSKNEPSFLSFLNMVSGTKLSFHSSELWADRVPLRLGFTSWILWKGGCRGHSDIDITIGHSEVEITRAQMGYSPGTSHGEKNGEVPSLSISEHHRPRAIALHKGHTLEQLLAGIRAVLQGNVCSRSVWTYQSELSIDLASLWDHLIWKSTWGGLRDLVGGGGGLEGRGVTEPLSRLFILVVLTLLFPALEPLVTQPQRTCPLLERPGSTLRREDWAT